MAYVCLSPKSQSLGEPEFLSRLTVWFVHGESFRGVSKDARRAAIELGQPGAGIPGAVCAYGQKWGLRTRVVAKVRGFKISIFSSACSRRSSLRLRPFCRLFWIAKEKPITLTAPTAAAI